MMDHSVLDITHLNLNTAAMESVYKVLHFENIDGATKYCPA